MRVFTCQQCEYSSSGSDVSVNAVIIPQNWGAIPSSGLRPRNDDRIHRYILPRTTAFPQYPAIELTLQHAVGMFTWTFFVFARALSYENNRKDIARTYLQLPLRQ